MTLPDDPAALLRISDADRNGTLRRLHNAVALGLIDIDEFEERSVQVATARLRDELDLLVGDLPGPGSVVTTAAVAYGADTGELADEVRTTVTATVRELFDLPVERVDLVIEDVFVAGGAP